MIADSVNSVLADIEFKLSNYKLKVVNAIIKTRDSKKHSDIDSIFHDELSLTKPSKVKSLFFQQKIQQQFLQKITQFSLVQMMKAKTQFLIHVILIIINYDN